MVVSEKLKASFILESRVSLPFLDQKATKKVQHLKKVVFAQGILL